MRDPITVSVEDGHFSVQQANRRAERLTWGEMIEQVINLSHPAIERPRYRMLTEAESVLDRARSELRRAEKAVEEERSRTESDERFKFTNGAL